MIPRIAIPGSGISITRIGLGCVRVRTGKNFAASAKLIEAALASGIRHFDTAPSYGWGLSETLLGEVLAGVPNVTIGTKVGIPGTPMEPRWNWYENVYRKTVRPILGLVPRVKRRLLKVVRHKEGGSTKHAPVRAKRHLARQEVMRGIEESLRYLKRNYVDLFLIHDPDQYYLDEELVGIFRDLQRSGAIRSFGLAFGGVAGAGDRFGGVLQGRLPPRDCTPSSIAQARIFHGVLRYDWPAIEETHGRINPGAFLQHVLGQHQNSAIIFSASGANQIRNLMREFESASTEIGDSV
jgi:hypothetical protein